MLSGRGEMLQRTYTEAGQERFWFDIFSAIVLFITAIGGAWLPKYLCTHGHVSSSKSLAFHLGNMLSAGGNNESSGGLKFLVLHNVITHLVVINGVWSWIYFLLSRAFRLVMLSAGFCHLLADAHRSLLFWGRFPISNFLAATGYIITLLADQVVQFVSEQQAAVAAKSDRSTAGATLAGLAGPGTPTAVVRNGGYTKLPSGAELTSITASSDTVLTGQEGALTTPIQREGAAVKAGAAAVHDPEAAMAATDGGSSGAAANGGCCPPAGRSHLMGGNNSKSRPQPQSCDEEDTGSDKGARSLNRSQSAGGADCHSAGVVVLLGGGRKLSFATAVLLAAALCIHSILEGMALGAQSSMRSTEDIMIAIAAHKGLAAYALGASIVESGACSSRFWTVIACFSLATPLGIFAGYSMSSTSSNGKSGAALSALASGTFLYVAFMEVIPKELADGKHRMAKMGAFLTGYCLMSLLAVWA